MTSLYDQEVVQQRVKYVLEVKDQDKSIAQAARDAHVDWKTMKSWLLRFEESGVEGLLNKPRGRFRPIDYDLRKQVIELKIQNRSRSARKIRDILKRSVEVSLHRQTIWRILKEAGESRRVKDSMKVYRDFERPRPNSLWQIDIMDAIIVEGLGLVYLVLIIDDHSRKIVGHKFVQNRGAYHVFSTMWDAFEGYGIPSQMYSDQGRQFRSHLGRGHSHYERVCKRLGIDVIFGTVNYPQGRGKIERLFGFIQDDFLPEHRFTDLEDINDKFNDWVDWYNNEHEHSSLNNNSPNSRYQDFTPRLPVGDLFEIFSEHFTRKVRKNATISFRGKIYPVDPRYIREKVDLKVFGNVIKIFTQSGILGEYDNRIDYREKMMRRVYTRIVKKDGTIKFLNDLYPIGKETIGQKVEIVVIKDQMRAFLRSNKLLIFKIGESDAVVVSLDR